MNSNDFFVMGKIEVLYVCHTAFWDGASLSLFNMIHSLRDYVIPIVLIPREGETTAYCEANGIEYVVQKFSFNIKSKKKTKLLKPYFLTLLKYKIRDWICTKKICMQLENRNIQIVHSNVSTITIGVNLSKKMNAKHVWHIREFMDLDFKMQPITGWRKLKNMIYSADAIIAITNAVYQHWGLNARNNAHIIWNAVRSKDDIAYIPQKEHYFFFSAASITEAKGLDVALEAFGVSRLKEAGYRLFIAGRISDEYKATIDKIIAKYELNSCVNFLGYCNNVKEYMKNATAFLMCSRNEALGRVTVEAMFYGCPVIGKNTGGTLELIEENQTGFLFSNVQECARKMLHIIQNDVSKIILNAQNFVLNNFTEECYTDKIWRIYQKML